MTIYITQGNYTENALKTLVANPEDRTEAVRGLIEAAGGKLLDYYVTFGEHDFLIISEGGAPNEIAGALLAAGASGIVCNLKTVPAMTMSEAKDAFARAKSVAGRLRPPGG